MDASCKKVDVSAASKDKYEHRRRSCSSFNKKIAPDRGKEEYVQLSPLNSVRDRRRAPSMVA